MYFKLWRGSRLDPSFLEMRINSNNRMLICNKIIAITQNRQRLWNELLKLVCVANHERERGRERERERVRERECV